MDKKTKTLACQIYDAVKEKETFHISDLKTIFDNKPYTTLRGRIYDNLGKLFKRIDKGIYTIIDEKTNTAIAMLNQDGRDLSNIPDESFDAIITDHPYKDPKSLNGGNRHFAEYETFQYTQEDFNEKARVLKEHSFLVEFFAEENANNYKYIYKCKEMAERAGLRYYCTVPWKKGNFVANTGRKAKNTEQAVFFTKGSPRSLRPDNQHGGTMAGTTEMLPTALDYQPKPVREKIHKAEKPVPLLEQIIRLITKPGEAILDTFAGSGNLGIAAINTGRIAVLIEKCKETFETMVKNITNTNVNTNIPTLTYTNEPISLF